MTVDAAELNGNATVAAANSYSEAPAGQYVIVQITTTYTGESEGEPGFELTALFHGNDARQYSDSDCFAMLFDDAMEAPTLNPGGTDTFPFCMDVAPAAIAGGQLSIEPTLSWESDSGVFYAVG